MEVAAQLGGWVVVVLRHCGSIEIDPARPESQRRAESRRVECDMWTCWVKLLRAVWWWLVAMVASCK